MVAGNAARNAECRQGSFLSRSKRNRQTLKPYLKEQIDADSRLMTDEASQYTLIGREFVEHGVVSHGIREYVRGDIHTNMVEGYFSIFKRGLKGSFHHISPQHLKRSKGCHGNHA